MEAKVDVRKLQLLNDRINQTIEALTQVRASVQGLGHTTGMVGNVPGVTPNIPGGRYPQQQAWGASVPGAFGAMPGYGIQHTPGVYGAIPPQYGIAGVQQQYSPPMGYPFAQGPVGIGQQGLSHTPSSSQQRKLLESQLAEMRANELERVALTFPHFFTS
jgi:hypothetical protein